MHWALHVVAGKEVKGSLWSKNRWSAIDSVQNNLTIGDVMKVMARHAHKK